MSAKIERIAVPGLGRVGTPAATSKGVMAPQCGLAPGLVAILGVHLAAQFEHVRAIRSRVGAPPPRKASLTPTERDN